VTAVGGLKEKCLAAHRMGISTVVLPAENRKDLKEIPRRVRRALRFVLVDHVDEVLRAALALGTPASLATAPRSGDTEASADQ
jgi:ATP-dependent Lon protease